MVFHFRVWLQASQPMGDKTYPELITACLNRKYHVNSGDGRVTYEFVGVVLCMFSI